MMPAPTRTTSRAFPRPRLGTNRLTPKNVNSICVRTMSVTSTTTLAPAGPTRTPRSARSHAFTTFPPIWRTGRRSLIDSPIQRAQIIVRRGGRCAAGTKLRQPKASAHTCGRWRSATARIPHPACRRAAATSSIPCQAMTAPKRTRPTASPAYAARVPRNPRSSFIGAGDADGPGSGLTWGFMVRACREPAAPIARPPSPGGSRPPRSVPGAGAPRRGPDRRPRQTGLHRPG